MNARPRSVPRCATLPSTRTTTRRAPGGAVPLTIPYEAWCETGRVSDDGGRGGGGVETTTVEP